MEENWKCNQLIVNGSHINIETAISTGIECWLISKQQSKLKLQLHMQYPCFAASTTQPM